MRIALLTILVTIISCRELVSDEFSDFETKPVVNSLLIADSTLKVHLSYTGDIDSNKLEFVTNAEIELFVNDDYVEKLDYCNNGTYCSSFAITPGNTYQCRIDIPGYETIFCADSVPVPTGITGYKHINQAERRR